MTPQRGEAGRGHGASRDEAPAASGTALVAIILGALLLRLVVAYVLFPGAGFKVDIGSFQSWAVTLAQHGPGGFYTNTSFSDYTPGYLYLLWLVGLASQALADLSGASPFSYAVHLIKVPAIIFDLALGALIYRALLPWSGQRTALIGAALYLFNPVTWYESALWGQVDSVGTFVLLAAVLLLIAGWSEGAAGAAVLAAIIKPQYLIVVFVVGIVLMGRHLLAPGSGPVPTARHPLAARLDRALGGWFTAEQGPWRLVSSAAVGMAVLFAVITPFDLAELAAQKAPGLAIGGDLGGLFVIVGQAVGQYHFVTVNAYNLWALVGSPSLAEAGLWNTDLEPVVGPVSYFAIGAFLLAVTLTFLAYQFLRRDDRTSILITATVVAVAFFVVPTRVHERYLFPAFALGTLLAAGSRSWRWWYLALAAVNVVNLHANLTNPLYGTAGVIELPFGEASRSAPMVTVVAVAHTALFGWALLHVRPALDDLVGWLTGRASGGGDRPAMLAARARHAGIRADPGRPEDRPPGTPHEMDAHEDAAHESPAGEMAPLESPAREAGPRSDWLDVLRRRLERPAVRADRSALLHREGPGRIDRLDLLALVLIVVVGLTIRGFRGDQPFRMVTLDEVYHARTATEFLQDWRYGMHHAIYEYTHPHLAKYFMAAGVVALGNDRVVATSSLGTPVRSVALEPPNRSADAGGDRAGGRLFVATGTEVRVLGLRTGRDEARLPVPAATVALDLSRHSAYAGGADGVVWWLDTALLDRWRAPAGEDGAIQPIEVGRVAGPVDGLWAVGAERLVVRSGDRLRSLDPATGEVLADRAVPGVVAGTALDAFFTEEGDRAALAAAVPAGVVFLDGATLDTLAEVHVDAGALGLDLVGSGNDRSLAVATGDGAVQIVKLPGDLPPSVSERVGMPGPVRDVRWNPATELVHVLGETPSGQPTVYVVEWHGKAVFADAALPFSPVAWALDVDPAVPAADRGRALLLAADGSSAAVDIGRNGFAWRFPGILLGVLMVAATYLLGRVLFHRRAIALIAAGAMLTDGLLFAHSRDAMNDAYVGFFVVAAVALLAWLWLPRGGRRGTLAVAAGLPLVGVLLGLALASKWAGAFGIGAALLIVLLRSASGRIVALAGMVVLTGTLGHLALATGNATFALLMLGLTLLMAVTFALRPIAFSSDELRYGGLLPAAAGLALLALVAAGIAPDALEVAGTEVPLAAAGIAAIALGAAAWGALALAARVGLIAVAEPGVEPPALPGDAAPPPAAGWLRPGAGWGLPTTYALACLTVVPLLVYVLSYVPWARPWAADCATPANRCPQVIPATIAEDGTTLSEGWPVGHRGQTLLELTGAMYDYHNDLRATHPAASPWWAWPLDLKPVWLYQQGHGPDTRAVIYEPLNLVTAWLAVPAIGFGFWQAWRRRSLALLFVAVAFLAQWLAWARIDRATFQYHFYPALPFALLFLGYFLAELWHGPSRRTWLLARAGAAVALLGPGLLWLAKDPLCTLAGVTDVAPESYLCIGASGPVAIPAAMVATAIILLAGLGLLARELLDLGRDGMSDRGRFGVSRLARVGVIVVVTGAAATVMPGIVGPGTFTFTASLGHAWVVGLLWLAVGIPLAWIVLGAGDPRRYVGVVAATAIGWFMLFYPYIAALPLPGDWTVSYRALMPTWDYSFQFAVNRDAAPRVGMLDPQALVLVVSAGLAATVALLLVRQWRLDRAAEVRDDLAGGAADQPADQEPADQEAPDQEAPDRGVD